MHHIYHHSFLKKSVLFLVLVLGLCLPIKAQVVANSKLNAPLAHFSTAALPSLFFPGMMMKSISASVADLGLGYSEIAQGSCAFMTQAGGSEFGLMLDGTRRYPSSQSVGDSIKTSQLRWLYNNLSSRDRLDLLITLAEDQTVDIALYNILGKKVKDLDHAYMTECKDKEISYSVSDVPVGAYVVAAQGTNFRAAVRIVISQPQ